MKEHLGDLPDRFRDAGYAVLAYDHRNFGSSDGLPRQEANLVQQSDDLFDVITYVATLAPAIDPNKIITWGPGHGAGIAMPLAAVDKRVKAAVFALPFISGVVDSEKFPKGAYDRAVQERIERVANRNFNKDPIYHPIFADTVEEAKEKPWGTVIGAPQAVPFHAGAKSLSDAAATPWDNKITIQSLFIQRRWEPTALLPQVTIPTLYITARQDEFTEHKHHMEAYEKMGGLKQLLIMENENLESFAMPENRETLLKTTFGFLKKHGL